MSETVWTRVWLFRWPVIFFMFAFLIRLPFLANAPGGWDDVDFALALKNYDVAQMQPHFPGYPIYLLAAFGLFAFIPDEFVALSLLSALSAALAVFPLYVLVEKVSGTKAAVSVLLLWSVAPLVLVLGTQPLSDSFGTLVALCVLASSISALEKRASERKRAIALLASGIFLGLLYGVRLSYLPLATVPLWAGYVYLHDTKRYQDFLRAVTAAVLVSALWVFGLAYNVGGFDVLWTFATAFTAGHFSDWGGTYHEGASLIDRLTYLFNRQLFAAGIGTPWPGQHAASFLVLGFVIAAFAGLIWRLTKGLHWKGHRRQWGMLVAWVIPYLLWAIFAQNVEKPRHLLPLLPALLWLLALGLLAWKRVGYIMVLFLCVAMFTVGITQIKGQSVTPSPMVQLASFLQNQSEVASSVIFTYEEERVIRYQDVPIDTIRLRKFSDFQIYLLNYPLLPKHIYLTDSVLQGFKLPAAARHVHEVAKFSGSPWLYPTYHDIVLYEVRPDSVNQLIRFKKIPEGNN